MTSKLAEKSCSGSDLGALGSAYPDGCVTEELEEVYSRLFIDIKALSSCRTELTVLWFLVS